MFGLVGTPLLGAALHNPQAAVTHSACWTDRRGAESLADRIHRLLGELPLVIVSKLANRTFSVNVRAARP